MISEKKHFFVKLIPSRLTFPFDITDEERNVMKEHAAYWQAWQDKGYVIVYGPVFDPNGTFGMGVIETEDEAFFEEFQKNDPAVKIGHRHEIYPMKAVTKSINES